MDLLMVITAVKVIVSLLGGVLGALGILFNFKRTNNRLSRWGVAVLVGIVISAVVGVVGSIVEGYKAKSDAVQQAARTEQLLSELGRAIQPITQLEITFWVRLPSGAPQIQGYLTTVSSWIEARLDSLPRKTPLKPDGGIHITSSGLGGEPLTIEIGNKSALWPRGKDALIAVLVRAFKFDIFIRKTPIAEENFAPIFGTDGRYADWMALGLLPTQSNLNFDRRGKHLEIFSTIEYQKSLWISNGKIASIPDLYGAQLFLVPPCIGTRLPPDLKSYEDLERAELIGMIDLKTIVLKFSVGRDIWIDGKAFKKFKTQYDDCPVFSIVLPPDGEGARRLAPQE